MFKDYILEARDNFVIQIEKQEWNTQLRNTAENLLIAYDQMRNKLAGYKARTEPQAVSGGVWVKASERLPVGRKPAVNIYLQEVGWLNILKKGAVFETIDKVFYDYEFSEEKLYNHIFWLDESLNAGNDAVEFALWLINSDHYRAGVNEWKPYSKQGQEDGEIVTTEQLYQLFKEKK